MSFSLSSSLESFEWPVEVKIPAKGKYKKAKFNAEFALLDDDALDEASKNLGGHKSDVDFCVDVVVGWDETVTGDDGEPLEFNEANCRQVMKIPYVRSAVISTYFDAIAGQAREKN